MHLYHGTSAQHLDAILREGLKPRGRAKGNWKHTIESNPKAVYLTDAYPFHFAEQAAKGEPLVVFEIDTDELMPWLFAPDEDFLEQITREQKNWVHVKGDFITRTRWFRKRALKEFQEYWKLSLKGMGTCTYYGPIPARSITRYAVVDSKAPIRWLSDPTVSPLNYLILGGFYRDLTRKIFGDHEMINDNPCIDSYRKQLKSCPRTGIEVFEMSGIVGERKCRA